MGVGMRVREELRVTFKHIEYIFGWFSKKKETKNVSSNSRKNGRRKIKKSTGLLIRLCPYACVNSFIYFFNI